MLRNAAAAAAVAVAAAAGENARRVEEDAAALGLETGSSAGVDWDALAERLSPDFGGADPFETFLFVCHVLDRARRSVDATRDALEAADTPESRAAREELTRAYLSAFSDVMAAATERLELDVCLRR